MRRGVVLLLLLGFALQGLTALAAMNRCGPISAEQAMSDSPMSDDCCVDLETWARTGDACKDGQSCQAAQQTPLLAQCEAAAFAAPDAWHFDYRLLRPPPIVPARVWRPPALS